MVIEFVCPGCRHKMRVADHAAGRTGKCKKCDMSVKVPAISTPQAQKPESHKETTLYSRHPSMFRNRPILFLVFVLLIAVYGIGLLLFILWLIRCLGTTLTVTDKRTTLRSGLLSKRITEIWHRDVRNVLVEQSFFQRIFSVGDLGISSAGGSDIEIKAYGMPAPYRVKEIVDAGR